MKNKHCCAMLFLLLFSRMCLAQNIVPVKDPLVKEVSFSYILADSNRNRYFGWGGEATATHFLTNNVDFQAEADYVRTDYANLHDMGVRGGPVVHLWSQHPVQPYIHLLMGYAFVESWFLRPETSFHGAPSIVAGAGLDLPIAEDWNLRLGVDVERDWTTIATELGRGVVGISYHFGPR